MFNGEYLGLDLEAEVGVEVTQLHLVVQQHGVVAVLRRVCSLEGARNTKKQEIKRVFITQSPPLSADTQPSGATTSASSAGVPRGFPLCKCQNWDGDDLGKSNGRLEGEAETDR